MIEAGKLNRTVQFEREVETVNPSGELLPGNRTVTEATI